MSMIFILLLMFAGLFFLAAQRHLAHRRHVNRVRELHANIAPTRHRVVELTPSDDDYGYLVIDDDECGGRDSDEY